MQRLAKHQVLEKIMLIAPSFEHIEKMVGLIEAPNRSQTDPFPGGGVAFVSGEYICLQKKR